MSSRREEKERRRAERIAQEQVEAARKTRVRRLQIGFGGLLALAAVAAIVVAITAAGGKGSRPVAKRALPPAPIPSTKIKDLNAAAKAAGCIVRSFPLEGRNHVSTPVHYRTNPPTSGNHSLVPAHDGDYVGQAPPPVGQTVHALEHGRVEIQYQPRAPRSELAQLETLFNEPLGNQPGGSLLLLFQNQTGMKFAVSATAWQHYVACPRFNRQVFDAIRAFRATYTGQAPEQILQPE